MKKIFWLVVCGLLVVFAFAGEAQARITTFLAWDASSEPGLAGYKVRYGLESGVYTNEVVAGKVYEYASDQGLKKTLVLSAGRKYYFVVVPYDAGGVDGEDSNEVSITFSVDMPESLIFAH